MSESDRRITTVCFDFYNTLYAAHEWFELEVRELPVKAMQALGVAYTPEQEVAALVAYRRAREKVHRTGVELSAVDGLRLALEAAGVSVAEDLYPVVEHLQWASFVPGREEAGMVACVRLLATRGYRLGVISNALSSDFPRWSLVGSGIDELFAGVYCSAEVGYYKTSPRLYEAALRGLGARPDEAIHVGDNYRFDVQGAKAAGLRAVWYSPAGEPPPGNEADAVIRHLSQLPDVAGATAGRAVG